MPASIYVEIEIDAPLDELWRFSQDPDIHERWDLRFSEIDYEAGPDPDGRQQFRYARHLMPGVRVEGRGESTGERSTADGVAASALRFWSDQRRSLIRTGSGYWRYVPQTNGTLFLTRYDYTVRWGAFGRFVDRLLFRRMIGWATAWSFDALRIWIEQGTAPDRSLPAIAASLMSPPAPDRPRASRCARAPSG